MQCWCIVDGIRVRDTPKSPPLSLCICLCVCECDSREQLSPGRCTQQGAIRHGRVTHIKDAQKHTHTQTCTSMKVFFLRSMCHDNHKAGIL